MKRTVARVLLTLGSLGLIASLPAFGMVSGEVRANIPFAFRVGKAKLPAGEYLIASAASDHPEILEIRNMDGGPSALVVTQPLSPMAGTRDKCELEFRKVGGQEYLTQIWESTIEQGDRVALPPTPATSSSNQPGQQLNAHGQKTQKS